MKFKQQNFQKSLSEKKIHIPYFDVLSLILTSSIISTISFLVTYPFDLAYGRTATCLGNKKFSNIADTFIAKSEEPTFFKYYNGASYAAINSIIYSSITFTGYQLLFNYTEINKNNTFFSFMCTSAISLIASLAAYPYDTAKRRYQVLSIVDVNVSESIIRKGKYR
jgi:hypothetical protein